MMVPAELKYTKDHEWVRVEGNTATIGITDHAQKELGDIVFLDLPKGAGTVVSKGDPLGTVESVKTLSDVYAPVSGTVLEVNSGLTSSPEQVNEEPYGSAWMVKLTLGDPSELDGLMSASDYEAYLATQEH